MKIKLKVQDSRYILTSAIFFQAPVESIEYLYGIYKKDREEILDKDPDWFGSYLASQMGITTQSIINTLGKDWESKEKEGGNQ